MSDFGRRTAFRRGLIAAAGLLLALLAACEPQTPVPPSPTPLPPTVTAVPPTAQPASVQPPTATPTVGVLNFELEQGYGAQKGFWTV